MRVNIVQHDIVWAAPEENQRRLDKLLSEQPAADLYVLPEMFATGFPCNTASRQTDDLLAWMKRKARERDAAIAGSLATTEAGRCYNRFCFVMPDGEVTTYDKRHLFGYGGETGQYTAGNRRVVVSFRGVRFLLQVCYDLRFPVWSRCQGDYDAIIYVANWPESRIQVWDTLLRARAIENQCYVVGVNRVGDDPQCHYCGHSVVIDPRGTTLAACQENQECTADALLDMERLIAFRQKFPVLSDADRFSIENQY